MTGKMVAETGGWSRWFHRGPWEMGATVVIAIGIAMLMQPISLDLFRYSFVTILAGALGFVVVSHFPR